MIRSVLSKKPLVNSNRSTHNSMNQRSIVLYHSAIKSEATRIQYDYHLNKFKKYFIIKNFDKLVEIEDKKIQIMIEDYLLHSRDNGKNYGSLASCLNALRLFFSMNDVIINWVKLKKMLPEKKKASGQVAYTTNQIQTLLKYAKKPKFKALIHLLSASAVRIGAFQYMKIKHIQPTPFESDGTRSVLVYADTRAEYYTFIHQEAVEALDEYLDFRTRKGEIITPDSWVFPKQLDFKKPATVLSLSTTMSRYVKNSLNRGSKDSELGRYEIMVNHGFRKRFDTICKNNDLVNNNNSEKLMGHSVTIPLDNHYHKPKLETLFDEYKKHIHELMIDDKFRLQEELKKKDEKINKLNQKDNEIDMLKQTILEIKLNMLELQNTIKS